MVRSLSIYHALSSVRWYPLSRNNGSVGAKKMFSFPVPIQSVLERIHTSLGFRNVFVI